MWQRFGIESREGLSRRQRNAEGSWAVDPLRGESGRSTTNALQLNCRSQFRNFKRRKASWRVGQQSSPNSSIQNRLRISDYRRLLATANFEVLREVNVSGKSEDLQLVQLAPQFRNYTTADQLVTSSWITARPN
jgi:hypothetical protein